DQIGTTAQHHHDAFGAVGGGLDLVRRPVTEAVEELGEHLPDGLLIVDDEDALRGSFERFVGALDYARHARRSPVISNRSATGPQWRISIVLSVLHEALPAPEPGHCDRLHCQSGPRFFPE